MTIHERTYFNRGCNKCSKFSSSQETRIYCELKCLFPETKFRYKISGFELDIFIPSASIAVEYDGAFYHKDRAEGDLSKNLVMKELGIQLIRVREAPLAKILDWDVITAQRDVTKKDLDNLLSSFGLINPELKKLISDYHSNTGFFNEKEYSIYMSYFPSPFPENSLAETHPDIASQWDNEKNGPLTPYNFTHGSRYKVFWVCEYGHTHQATINSKVTNIKSASKGCAYCSGMKPTKDKSLKRIHSDLTKEWHPYKNFPLTPENVSPGSDRVVWWQCPVHPENEWEARIRIRVRGYERCQKCTTSRRNSIDRDKVKDPLKRGFKQRGS